MKPMNRQTNWWEELYDSPFEAVMRQTRSDEEMDRIGAFLVEALHLDQDALVFDQCCDTGRVGQAVAARGMRIIGVDQSTSSVARAREEAASLELEMDFEVADAFEWSPAAPCDGAYNWWTAFANTPSDSRNEQMLHRAFEALRPGGRFALDYFNLPFLYRHFERTRAAEVSTDDGELVLIERNRLDLFEGALRPSWTFIRPDGSREVHQGYIRLYQPHEVAHLMKAAGFTALVFYGGPDGSRLTAASSRCVIVGQKPPA